MNPRKRHKRRPNDMLQGNRKEWLPKNSTGRGYGSKRQDERAVKKTEWATNNPNALMTADEMFVEMQRIEQEAIRQRFSR